MSISGVFNSATASLQQATQGLHGTAETVARKGAGTTDEGSVTSALVESTVHRNAAHASARMVSRADEALETLGSLLDTRA